MDSISSKKREVLESVKSKNFEKAKTLCEDILKEEPQNSTILSLLGTIYYSLEDYKNSVTYLKQSYELQPKTELAKMIGDCYLFLDKHIDAYIYFEIYLKKVRDIDVLKKVIYLLYLKEKEHYKAIQYSLEVLEHSPFDMEVLTRLGKIYLLVGQFNESIKICNRALQIDPKNGDVWILKGVIAETLHYDNITARKCYRKAIKLGVTDEGYHNLALNYRYTDKNKSNYYAKLLLKSDTIEYRCNGNYLLGTNYFTKRNHKEGYKYFIHSWDNLETPFKNLWNGKPHKRSSCLFHFTHGLGDQMMFIRYLPMIAENFKTVKINCDESVMELFEYSYKDLTNAEFYPMKENLNCDYATSLFILPVNIINNFKNIPYKDKYLFCDNKKIEETKRKYFNTDKFKIGLCWEAGDASLRFLLNRTIPFQLFEPLLNLEGTQIYSVQQKSDYKECELFKNSNIIDIGKDFKTFYDTAGALLNLDLLVTVDTSVANLAGALGVKTLMLLPTYSDWRWFDEPEKCEWYNSIQIVKQQHPSTWSPEIEKVREKIQTMID